MNNPSQSPAPTPRGAPLSCLVVAAMLITAWLMFAAGFLIGRVINL